MIRRKTPRRSTTNTVNLLSPWTFENIATRRLRRRFAAGAVPLLLLVAAGWTAMNLHANQVEEVLDIEKGERTTLASQTAQLAPVRTFVSAVEKRRRTVSDAMRTEIHFSGVLTQLSSATPADVELTNFAVTLSPPDATAAGQTTDSGATDAPGTTAKAPQAQVAATSACPGPDPFGIRPVVGCLTLSGTAATREAVGQLVINLGDSKIFVEPFISTTTTSEGTGVTFNGTVGLSPEAFTGRHEQLNPKQTGASR